MATRSLFAIAGDGSAAADEGAELVMPTLDERTRIFNRIDYNGNGSLSLAEIDKAIVELWPQFDHKKAVLRAYKAADRNGDGFIRRREFRLLLEYIIYFNRLWDTFESIDANHDQRLDRDEFSAASKLVGHALTQAVNHSTSAASARQEDGGRV